MRPHKLKIVESFILLILMAACSVDGSVTEIPVLQSGELTIESTNAVQDYFGNYYIVGEIKNNLETPVGAIELEISILDDSGFSLLKSDDLEPIPSKSFFPILNKLAPGETGPFSFYFDSSAGVPVNYVVIVRGYKVENIESVMLAQENVQVVETGEGNIFLTGELVNLGSEWVNITNLAGGVKDDGGHLLSTNWTGTYASVLAPAGDSGDRDRTPFFVTFPVPSQAYSQWVLYWDANTIPSPDDYLLSIEITNSYFDEYGAAHLVGSVENLGSETVSTILIAGLYAEDGIVLDATSSFLPAPVLPGSRIPFELTYFALVNNLQTQAALVKQYHVIYDIGKTSSPGYQVVMLPSEEGEIVKEGTTWFISGEFTNSTTMNLGLITAMVSIKDQFGNMVASSYSYSYPEDGAYSPEESGYFDTILYLPLGMDGSNLSVESVIIAEIVE